MGYLSSLSTALIALSIINGAFAFNAPSNVPTWCGKPYMSTNQALDPGGQFQVPPPQKTPLLYVTLQPRYSIFLDSDETGDFIVDASISHIFGQPYSGTDQGGPNPELNFQIHNHENENENFLVSASVKVNTTANLVKFSLSSFNPRYQPYKISIQGTLANDTQIFSSNTEIYVLPHRSYGSAVKIDNLYGGLYVQNAANNWKDWYAIFPNGAYGDGGYLLPSNISFANLNNYADQGFNTISIVPDGGLPDQSYPINVFRQYWDHMDQLNLFNIFEMRFAFQNSTRISEQVEMWKNRTTLLMWYTADEPDGWGYALNSTKLAYDQLRELDPYHPVSLALNCQDFFYEEYSSGADIVFEDAYPVGMNATWSISWGTPCNVTYGDCGCDNCVGDLKDVSDRLDDLQGYQENLQGQRRKPTWAVVQVFGNQSYWQTVPNAKEVESMMMLAVNHDAKGLTYWLYPSTKEVNVGAGALGKVFQTEPARSFLFGTNAIKGLIVEGVASVDVSAWIIGQKMMIGVVSSENVEFSGTVSIKLSRRASSIDQVLYGNSGWTVNGDRLSKAGLKGFEIGILVLNL